MTTMRLPRSSYGILGTTFFLLISALSLAQEAKILGPHKPVPARMEHAFPLPPAVSGSMRGGPWFVDSNYKSAVYIKNGVENAPITVSPILYLSNGVKYSLPEIVLGASGTAVLDINHSLEQLGIAPYATLSGYVELDYQWPWDPICATIRNIDTTHSTIYTYGLHSSKPFSLTNAPDLTRRAQTIDGLWWKEEPNVSGFVALSNTTSQPLSVGVELSDDTGSSQSQQSAVVSGHGTKMLRLNDLLTAKSLSGGIRISFTGRATDLLVNGGLEDIGTGYSADIPFTEAPASATKSVANVVELGLMTGSADPMMHLPAGTTFSPYTALRNVSTGALVVTPKVWWMAGGQSRSTPLPALTLSPSQTRVLDFADLLRKTDLENFNGSFQLVFQVEGNTAGLLLAGGSVDATKTYVFAITPHGVSESGSKSLSYWDVANGDDTMVTVWNPADEAQDFNFRLDYSGGHYTLPIHLEPRATRSFNVSDITSSGLPDVQGNIIPVGIVEGGATMTGSLGDNEQILVAIDSGVYNARKATCGIYCQTCNGITTSSVTANPFKVPVGQQTQLTLYETWNTGSQYNDSSISTWTTSNSGMATVGTYGSGTAGLVAGVSAGSPTISATYPYNVALYTSYWCEGSSWSCPYTYTTPAGGSSGTIQVPTSLQIVAGTDSTTAEAACALGSDTGCGVARSFVYQVYDQTGAAITDAFSIWDSIAITSPNDLAAGGFVTTCTPANTGPCNISTGSNGQFQEHALSACSTVCRSNNACVTGGPTNANQTWHIGIWSIVQSISYYCSNVLVNGN